MKSFGAHAALAGLTMTVPAGAVYGLVGPNGAGKTTAIRHITGVLRADSGDVLADGEPIYENVAVKNRMACIPDEVFYFPQATINDMMHFYRNVYPGFDSGRFERLARGLPSEPQAAAAPLFPRHEEAGGLLAGAVAAAGGAGA